MLLLNPILAESPIHGRGLFAPCPIPAGTLLWVYASACDRRIPFAEADDEMKHFGYVNPQNPRWLVCCGDAARYWNFDATPNCGELWRPTAQHEAPLVALRDIAPGEELTLGLGTDADATRKLSLHHSQS